MVYTQVLSRKQKCDDEMICSTNCSSMQVRVIFRGLKASYTNFATLLLSIELIQGNILLLLLLELRAT